MSGVLLGAITLVEVIRQPLVWGLLLSAVGLWVAFAVQSNAARRAGELLGLLGLVVLAVAMPKLSALETWEQWTEQILYWLMAAIAVICSAAAVVSRNPVYTAIWFAASLLGVAGLFLFHNAQFLGVATIVVYAGAIVVTFLFVLMLANSEGEARYDRISWAKFPLPMMVLAAAAILGMGALSFARHPVAPSPTADPSVLASEHVGHFGGVLFTYHMISVEVVGAILLIALVGAVAIVIQGKERRAGAVPSIEEALGRSDSHE